MFTTGEESITEIITRKVSSPEASLSVLLIEDSPVDARLIRFYLTEGEASLTDNLTLATDLKAGLSQLAEKSFDVILLDLTLPDSTGIETFQRIHAAAPKLPIVVLSGHEDEFLAREIVKSGAQDCLSKSMANAPVLHRAIRHAIERKRVFEELRSMQMQLIQAEKADSVGRLAVGVAHEVKNPLAMIQLGIDYLSAGVDPEDPNVSKILESMRTAVSRADEIVRGLLDFASDRKMSLVPADINSVIEEAMVLVEIRTKGLVIEVVKDLGEDLPKVRIDESKMMQVLVNVLFNAIQAMAGNNSDRAPVLGISTYFTKLVGIERDEGTRSSTKLRTGDDVVVLEITDTGCGIQRDILERVFDPFFTTKPTGSGTGLGLTVVRRIVELHDGLIELVNRKDGGLKATITLRAQPDVAS